VANLAGVDIINSVYGVALRPAVRELGRDLLPLAALNSVTLLGAEMVGRAYGGGLLKLEPKEADQLPVPAPATLAALAPRLEALRPQVVAALRLRQPERAVELVDGVVLSGHLALSAAELAVLRAARDFLFQRRISRARPQAAAGRGDGSPDGHGNGVNGDGGNGNRDNGTADGEN
jgi:hypothetical protein